MMVQDLNTQRSNHVTNRKGTNLDLVKSPYHLTLKDLGMIFVSWLIVGNAVVAICQTIITTVEYVQ